MSNTVNSRKLQKRGGNKDEIVKRFRFENMWKMMKKKYLEDTDDVKKLQTF